MHKLHIEKFGPIENCDLTIDDFCVLTGEQASGKSTIAKVVFYFRTIKDEMLMSFLKYNVKSLFKTTSSFWEFFQRYLRKKFIETFDGLWELNPDMELVYYYNENTWAKIALGESYTSTENIEKELPEKFFAFGFSDNIFEYLDKMEGSKQAEKATMEIEHELQNLFCDEYHTVYVPAGREMITLLASQLDYLFMVMDDTQKASIDYCTRKYLEEMKKIRLQYEKGLQGLYQKKILTSEISVDKSVLDGMMHSIEEILKGKYVYVAGEERLMIDNEKIIKMNYASSGQQECVWILNLIFYYSLEGKKTFIILEEPEAHLYPETQKKMAELIALFVNMGNGTLVTTHSPYLLGAFNNLLYADYLGAGFEERVKDIICKEYWISREKARAFYTADGEVKDIMDKEMPLIKNEVIDGISQVINLENDKLLEIHMQQV